MSVKIVKFHGMHVPQSAISQGPETVRHLRKLHQPFSVLLQDDREIWQYYFSVHSILRIYVHVDMYDLLLVARAEHKTSRAGAKTDESRTYVQSREETERTGFAVCARAN